MESHTFYSILTREDKSSIEELANGMFHSSCINALICSFLLIARGKCWKQFYLRDWRPQN